MTVPMEFFGSGGDGAGWMEAWLADMCPGCRHGRTEDGAGGMGCRLPADAYADPRADIPEWSTDADPPGPSGLRCMRRAVRTRGRRRPRTVGADHPTLDLTDKDD